MYKERSDNIRNMVLIYISKEVTACIHVQHQLEKTNLTIIIVNIGTTNPHMAPSSVSIQQLLYNDRMLRHKSTNAHNLSCPYWSWATPAEIATIGTGIPCEIHLHLDLLPVLQTKY